MEPGYVVEYIDNQKIFCAVVLESKALRLRLLNENNREVKLSAGRLTHRSRTHLDAAVHRDKLVAGLKEIALRRRALSEQVDIHGLWEVLASEQEWVDLPTMTALCFPDNPNGDHEAAVVRAFFTDRLYFKFDTDQFFPHSEEKVRQILHQRELEERQARLVDEGADWLTRVLKGQPSARPEGADALTQILADYYLFENDSAERETARAILKKAAVGSPAPLFSFLVKVGAWQPHENLDLLRFDIRPALPPAVLSRAEALAVSPPADVHDRRDLRQWAIMTVDGPSTQDFDDALSLTTEGDNLLLGVHIADVGHYITRDDPVDQEAMARASSIYMPDLKIPMLPACLSEGLCSLRAGQDRPAISTLIRITPHGKILEFDIVPSLIRVQRQLTYAQVDEMMTDDPSIQRLHALATGYRGQRLDNGALPIELPELNVWLNGGGEPQVSRSERETPGRFLVAELMIMANDLAARFLSQRELPAIFRAQPEPRERLFSRDQGTFFQNWMQRKQLSRFALGSAPEPHTGVGVGAYVTSTSPIRKYTDLVTQRQLRAGLGLQSPYSVKEIDFIIAALQEPMARVGRVQFRRQRYWLLKYLEGCIGRKEEALVLGRRRDGYVIVLLAYLLEMTLSGADNVTLKPEDLIQVTIQHVNARNDVINVYLG
jgi:exoribonuclease-2